MADSSAESNVHRNDRVKEYDDPHYHDDDLDVSAEDKRRQQTQAKDKFGKRRPPPPRRRFEES